MIRAVIFDIDGTLMDRQKGPPKTPASFLDARKVSQSGGRSRRGNKLLRRSRESADPVVNSACLGSVCGLWEFGLRSRSASRPSRKAARGVCALTRGNKPARSEDHASLVEKSDKESWGKLNGSER